MTRPWLSPGGMPYVPDLDLSLHQPDRPWALGRTHSRLYLPGPSTHPRTCSRKFTDALLCRNSQVKAGIESSSKASGGGSLQPRWEGRWSILSKHWRAAGFEGVSAERYAGDSQCSAVGEGLRPEGRKTEKNMSVFQRQVPRDYPG